MNPLYYKITCTCEIIDHQTNPGDDAMQSKQDLRVMRAAIYGQ